MVAVRNSPVDTCFFFVLPRLVYACVSMKAGSTCGFLHRQPWGVPGCSGWALLLLESNGLRKGEGDREHAMPSERREKERVLAMRELCVSTSHAGILCLEPQMKRAKARKGLDNM